MEEKKKFEQTYILNTRNYLVDSKDIEDLINGVFKTINLNRAVYNQEYIPLKEFKVNNIEWYRRAFTHKSFVDEQRHLKENDGFVICNENKEWVNNGHHTMHYTPEESNQRLEYLGDSIIKSCQGTYLFRRFPGKTGENNEGFLTKMRIKLEKTSRLADFARRLHLDKFILLSDYLDNLENKKQGRNNEKTLEDVFEAFIGAIIEDHDISTGYYYSYYFIKGVMEQFVDFTDLILKNDNYKDSILKYFAKEKIPISYNLEKKKSPFDLVYTMGPSNNRVFVISISLTREYFDTLHHEIKSRILKYSHIMSNKINKECPDSNWADIIQKGRIIFGVGTDVSKIKAEQEASRRGMNHLGLPLNY